MSGRATSDKRTARGISGGGLPLLALVFIACGGADEAPLGEAASLQAVLSIERIEGIDAIEGSDATEGSGGTSSASAVAQFLVLPSDADAHETLDTAGLRTRLPQAGCLEGSVADAPELSAEGDALLGSSFPEGFPEQLELLEAGEVSINADGVVTRLALNLFPPSGNASGVIYTTPDQSAVPLPPGAEYAIRATGSDTIPPLTIEHEAPRSLRDVTVGGRPLDQVTSLVGGQPLDFTWAEGDPSDRVYIELTDADTSLLCAFADSDGSGTIPGALTAKLDTDSNVRLSARRVRELTRAQEPQRPDALLLETMVRFDFELTSMLRVD